jgi:hypothetical protein
LALWRSFLLYRTDSLSPKWGEQWIANQHYILFANNVRALLQKRAFSTVLIYSLLD